MSHWGWAKPALRRTRGLLADTGTPLLAGVRPKGVSDRSRAARTRHHTHSLQHVLCSENLLALFCVWTYWVVRTGTPANVSSLSDWGGCMVFCETGGTACTDHLTMTRRFPDRRVHRECDAGCCDGGSVLWRHARSTFFLQGRYACVEGFIHDCRLCVPRFGARRRATEKMVKPHRTERRSRQANAADPCREA